MKGFMQISLCYCVVPDLLKETALVQLPRLKVSWIVCSRSLELREHSL